LITLSILVASLQTSFIPNNCSDPYQIGEACNSSSTPCQLLNPCQNMGTCINNVTIPYGYFCACPPGFNGTSCQLDLRPCQSTTCWNNGTSIFLRDNSICILFIGNCIIPSNDNFWCSCSSGWQGNHCQNMIDYCQNVSCLNKGSCRPLLLDYKCECLSNMYSGQHCEYTQTFIVIRQYISKSVGYVAILVICSFIIFIITLDVLKYVFHIDVARDEFRRIDRRRARRRRKLRESKQPTIALRFLYVNKVPLHEQTVETTHNTKNI
jgi:hypothetical protein